MAKYQEGRSFRGYGARIVGFNIRFRKTLVYRLSKTWESLYRGYWCGEYP